MKKVIVQFLFLGLLLGFVAMAASSKGLPSEILGYENWSVVAKNLDMGGPHAGKTKLVYANSLAAKAWRSKTVLPFGSLIVKTAGASNAPTLVAVMQKQKNGWQYSEFFPKAGRYTLVYQGALCSTCHQQAKTKDFLFTRP